MRIVREQVLTDGEEANSNDRQALFQQMEKRYDTVFVQSVRDSINASEARDIQYLEMKQMQDILSRYRGRVKNMVRFYRQWKIGYEREPDELEKVYLAYEGIFLRQQLHDSWQLYVTVNKDYHEMRTTYLANLSQNPHWYSRA